MKHKVSELEGALLDSAVAIAQGWVRIDKRGHLLWCLVGPGGEFNMALISDYKPSSAWSVGGPLIERERITVQSWPNHWAALLYGAHGTAIVTRARGSTPLIAAMRSYVTSKFGEEVELP